MSHHRRILRYFGAKCRVARYYRPPEYATIVEPFAGSAAYSWRYNTRRVVLFDIDEELIACWHWLQRASVDDVMRLPILKVGDKFSEQTFACPEAEYYVRTWCSMGAKYFRGDTVTTKLGHWTEKARSYVARNRARIRHWEISCCDYKKIDIDAFGQATWFVDPPYIQQGGRYKHGSQHIDYEHLGQWCQELPGQAIVCEAAGATWLPFGPLTTQLDMRRKIFSEAVFYNTDLPIFRTSR